MSHSCTAFQSLLLFPLLVAHFLLKTRIQRPVSGARVGVGAHQSAVRSLHAACTSVRAGFSGTHLHTCPFLSCCRDDALWALDGLAAGSAGAARDSLAALAEICAAKRGRLALRSANLASDVLAAAGAAPGWLGACVVLCGAAALWLPHCLRGCCCCCSFAASCALEATAEQLLAHAGGRQFPLALHASSILACSSAMLYTCK